MQSEDVRRMLLDYFPLWVVALIALFVFGLIAITGKITQPDQCTFPAGVACTGFNATNTTLELTLVNAFPTTLDIEMIENDDGECKINGTSLSSGQSQTYLFTECDHPSKGRKVSTSIAIHYKEDNRTRKMYGSLIATVN